MLPGPTHIHACPRCKAFHRCATLATGNTLDATRWSDGKEEAPMLPEGPWIARCHACAAFFWLDATTLAGAIPVFYNPSKPGPDRATVAVEALGPDRDLQKRVLRHLGFLYDADAERFLAAVPAVLIDDVDAPGGQWMADLLRQAGATVRFDVRPAPTYPLAWCEAPDVQPLDGNAFLDVLKQGLARTPYEETYLRTRVWWISNDIFRARGARWISMAQRPPELRENLERLSALLEATAGKASLLMRAEIARQLGRFEAALALVPPGPEDPDDDEDWRGWAQAIAGRARAHDDSLVQLP